VKIAHHIRQRSARALGLGILLFLSPNVSSAKTYLRITSQPSGAMVEIDGNKVGTTPYEVEIPGGYLHGSKTVFGQLLRRQMHLRLTLEGYLPADMDLANGPQRWTALNGTDHGEFWLLKTDTFNVNLDKAATAFVVNPQTAPPIIAPAGGPTMSVEQLVKMANPAVLEIATSDAKGSGFLISQIGVAVTNAHVVEGHREVVVTTGNGQSFTSKVVYVDATLDLALLKLDGTGFPQLQIAETNSVAAGSTVIAIGTPSHGFQNTVTKGVVGGIGAIAGMPGTWIQSDAMINPGNSGGPLLNESGGVIGITTLRPFLSGDGRPLTGIAFALSSDDVLGVLRRFYPELLPTPIAQTAPTGTGKVFITANRDGADILVDGKFVGSTPSTFTLPVGPHTIEVKGQDGTNWKRVLEVLKDSEVKLNAVLQND
jgi:S1-C subfamily serine protease